MNTKQMRKAATDIMIFTLFVAAPIIGTTIWFLTILTEKVG